MDWQTRDSDMAALIRALEARATAAEAREAKLREALQLFLRLMDDDDYDFGELCEEFVPLARAALETGNG